MKCKGLCFRCEYRAQYCETGRAPRYECSMKDSSVSSCYMYKPVLPIVLEPVNRKDKRPRFGAPFIAPREKGIRVAEGKLKAKMLDNGNQAILYWTSLK